MRYESRRLGRRQVQRRPEALLLGDRASAPGLLLSGLSDVVPARLSAAPAASSRILIHDVTFILFAVAIVFHIYLGTAAEPGTFGSMTRGTVTQAVGAPAPPALVPRSHG